MGRLGKDPELRRTQSGVAVATFNVAVDRDFKDKATGQRATDWITCVAWRSTAEFVEKYFAKGSQVLVAGRLQMRDWTDKDGNKRISAEVQAENVYFAGAKTEGGQRELPEFEVMDDDDPDLPF
jgi:single-strand DNA-binding protein